MLRILGQRPCTKMATLKSNWRVSALYYYYHLLLLLMAGGAAVHRERFSGLLELRFFLAFLTSGRYFSPGGHRFFSLLFLTLTERFPLGVRSSANGG